MTRFFVTLLACVLLAFPVAAEKLTIDQIESAWGNVATHTGSFVQKQDGSTQTGTYHVIDSTLIIMTYDNQSAIIVFNGVVHQRTITLPDGTTIQVAGKNIFVIDPGFQTQAQKLGIFGKLLSHNPQIDELVTGGGDSETFTTVRLRHPNARSRGHVDLTFHNRTMKLRQWNSNIDGQHVVTVFH